MWFRVGHNVGLRARFRVEAVNLGCGSGSTAKGLGYLI